MKYLIYEKDSNPEIDPPCCSLSRSRLDLLLRSGRAQRVGERKAQYVVDLRDPASTKHVPADLRQRNWRVVGQTRRGYGPGMPGYQFLP